MLKSLNSRLWLTIDTLKISFYLYRIIFTTAIVNYQLYMKSGMDQNERVLQYLFRTMPEMRDRRLWTRVLFRLSIMFPDISSIAHQNDVEVGTPNSFFNYVLRDDEEERLILATQEVAGYGQNEIVDSIRSCYTYLCNVPGRELEVDKTERGMQIKDEYCYQAIRGFVFELWLGLDGNKRLKKEVNITAPKKKNETTRKKKDGTENTTTTGNGQKSTSSKTTPSSISHSLPPAADNLPSLSDLIKESDQQPNLPYLHNGLSGSMNSSATLLQQPNYHNGFDIPSEQLILLLREPIGNGFFNSNLSPTDGMQIQPPTGLIGNSNLSPTDGMQIQPPTGLIGNSNLSPTDGMQIQPPTGLIGNSNLSPTDGMQIQPPTDYSSLVTDENINSLQIISNQDLQRLAPSKLYVYTDQINYGLELVPVEVYAATSLVDYNHGRWNSNGPPTPQSLFPSKTATMNISPHVHSFLDPQDLLSVVRPKSGILDPSKCKLDFKSIITLLAKSQGTNTSANSKRRSNQFSRSIEFGVRGELQSKDRTFVYGDRHFAASHDYVRKAQASLASIIDFLWDTGQSIQRLLKKPGMGGNKLRQALFGSKVAHLFGSRRSQFESVTVAHTILYPSTTHGHCHKDKMNDSIYAYSKTLCLNLVLRDEAGNIHLLQVIGNFRSSCRSYLSRDIHVRVPKINRDISIYRYNLQLAYATMVNIGSTGANHYSFCKDPFDLSDFFLDDSLPFDSFSVVSESKPKDSDDRADLLKLPIGSSRLISLSIALDTLYQQRHQISTDQLLECCFFASFIASATAFGHVISKIISEDPAFFENNSHPFYRLMQEFKCTMGNVHSGSDPRYSSASDKFKKLIPDNCKPTKEADKRLSKIGKELLRWVDIINSYENSEVPFVELREEIKVVVSYVQDAADVGDDKLDFAQFRLSIFTTFICGLGIVKPGFHLHQIIIPAQNTAAIKHLKFPFSHANGGSTTGGKIEQDVDWEMEVVSQSLGFDKYRRGQIEILLCESTQGRDLRRKDVFRKGQSLFWMDGNGQVLVKEYGRQSIWVPIEVKKEDLMFVQR